MKHKMNPQEAAHKLLSGELVVFPTETVYGLAALANNNQAVQNIFVVKGRPQENPLILHIAELSQLDELVKEIPESAQKLIDAFWPGPLTICYKKSERVSDLVSAGLDTICVRMPDHPIAQEFLKEVDQAVAAPSANLSGKPSTTRFQDAVSQLKQDGIYFLNGDDTPIGLESTVVDCSSEVVRILRPGSISQSDIEAVIGSIIQNEKNKRIMSPGQLLEHYAPQGNLTVIIGDPEQRRSWIKKNVELDKATFGLIGASDQLNETSHQHLSHFEEDFDAYAKQLYTFLNWCDRVSAKHIFLEFSDKQDPLSEALLNRLEKASKGNIIRL
jgi:L-threonylcarbamoyladenylate synthase